MRDLKRGLTKYETLKDLRKPLGSSARLLLLSEDNQIETPDVLRVRPVQYETLQPNEDTFSFASGTPTFDHH